ncbi:SDR family oxidoreductase [Saccharothrix hoggarensis]|uniref:SDR family oxidoreductase n=1 Tax=Saccharothrix hoggarensis TaxID=913853 RepID=A0ABW3QL39_9PSEU
MFSGKRAVITGGTHGMGLAIVKALLAGGADVLTTGYNERNVEAAQRELGPKAHVVRSDTTDLADIDVLGKLVEEKLGSVDYVHINAGFAELEPFDAVTEATFDKTFAINTKGAFFTVQRLLPMISEGGAVVFTTAVADGTGTPGMATFSGAKAAVRAFAQVLAAELLPRRIRVNVVSPGFIKTPTMGVATASPEYREHFEIEGAALTPLGRIGTPEEVAQASLFLAFGATFTTGVELPVDGGIAQGLVPLGSE